MLTWLWRFLVTGFPSKPGMTALRNRVEAVEKLCDQFISEVKEQRGRIVTALRSRKKDLEDPPQEEIVDDGSQPPAPGYGHYPLRGSSHLARRFKGG